MSSVETIVFILVGLLLNWAVLSVGLAIINDLDRDQPNEGWRTRALKNAGGRAEESGQHETGRVRCESCGAFGSTNQRDCRHCGSPVEAGKQLLGPADASTPRERGTG